MESRNGEKKVKELKDPIELMASSDFKDRFKAEFCQLAIRYKKLKNMIDTYNNLGFAPNCSRDLLFEQLIYMKHYINILKLRANVENIDLKDIIEEVFTDGTR